MPRTRIVIVNYRTADLTIDCLRSLSEEIPRLGEARVILTDNHSPDDSVGRLTQAIAENGWGGWVTLMPLERNGGFSYGNNQAIRIFLAEAPKPDFILLLNPDTVVRPGALVKLVNFMEARPAVGIAGSRLEFPDGTAQVSAFRFHSILSEVETGLRFSWASRLLKRHAIAPPVTDVPKRTDWVAGASMLIRRAVFEKIGLLDEGYFMYYEEVDFCRRAKRAGFSCWYEPASHVVHLVGQSSGVTERGERKRIPQYVFDSRRRYYLKNHGGFYTALVDAGFLLSLGAWRVRRRLQRKPDADPPHVLGDHFRNSVLARGFRL